MGKYFQVYLHDRSGRSDLNSVGLNVLSACLQERNTALFWDLEVLQLEL